MSAHTPGPWKYGELSGDIVTRDGESICTMPVLEAESSAEQVILANARLIAAAPELFAALTAVLAYVDDHIDINNNGGPNWAMRMAQELGDQVGAAVKKATGVPK